MGKVGKEFRRPSPDRYDDRISLDDEAVRGADQSSFGVDIA
jgi:hypothetical protein